MSTVVATNFKHTSSTSNNMVLDSSGNATFAGTAAMASSFQRNRLINGAMNIAQRATSATVTAGTTVPTASTGYPCVDRWFVYSTGANVTAAQTLVTSPSRNVLRVTGAASVTAVGIGQRIEALNSYDLAGQTCVLSVTMANSLLTTVTWTASYANSADAFGTIGTATKTQIATGTFTVNSTLTRYTTTISVPSGATTGIEILFTVGAQTSGTWDVTEVQLEAGSAATPFERRHHGHEALLCQRYFQSFTKPVLRGVSATGSASRVGMSLMTPMRVAPTPAISGTFDTWDGSTIRTTNAISVSWSTINSVEFDFTAGGGTAGTAIVFYIGSNTGTVTASAEVP